jgi:DNA-binding NtrC family response regulator
MYTSKTALVVHPDMNALSRFQAALSAKGFVTIVARDLPTALLAITQHHFDAAIVSSQLAEEGDGWPLAGVLHLVFPGAFIGVLVPSQPDVLTLQAAINCGAREAFPQSRSVQEIVDSIPTKATHTRSQARSQPVQ